MRRKLFVACVLSGLMALLIQPAFAQTSASASLVGSWQLTLVASGTTTQVAGLANFTSDGGAIATAGGILVGPVSPTSTTTALNPAFGNWNGCCAFGTGAAINLLGLVTNADGSIHATRSFQATVTVSPDGGQFTGTYSLQITVGAITSLSSGAISGALIPHFLPPSS
jgi:hypothetical protein